MAAALSGGERHGPSAVLVDAAGGRFLTRRATLPAPASLDIERRTFTAVVASGTAVRRPPPAPDNSPESWTEILKIDAAAVDLTRLNAGAPLLVAHDQSRHVGVVTAARIEGGQLIAEIKLSQRADVNPILQDISDGVLSQCSAGYRVERWRKTPAGWLAERWQPLEISLLPIAADGNARIRAHPIIHKEALMPNDITTTEASAPEACSWSADQLATLIRSATRLGLPAETAIELRERGLSLDAARDALIDAKAEADEKIQTRSHRAEVGHSYDSPQAIIERMAPAVLNRMNPSKFALPDASREFRGLSLVDMRRALLEANGVRTRGWTDHEVVTRSLHTTSDLPALLANALGKSLDAHDADMESPIKLFSRERTASDFKELMTVRLGVETALQVTNEAGEFRRGRLAEEASGFALKTAGIIIGLTRQSIVNDDTNALTTVADQLRALGADYEAEVFTTLLVGSDGNGAVCGDGIKLFASQHGNVAAVDAAPSVESIGALRELLRAQKTVGGKILAGSVPKAIIAPPALETVLEQILYGTLAAPDTASANPFSGRLALHIENRLADSERWYAVSGDAFEHAYLSGAQGVFIETRMGFDVDGVEIKARLDFGASVRDWRRIAANHGTAPGA